MACVTIDNDILIKSIQYGLLGDFLAALRGQTHRPRILGTAEFVLRSRLRKSEPTQRVEQAIQELKQQCEVLEPTEDEADFAAELELRAQMEGVQLDAGESQLIAVTILRNFCALAIGDKRAIQGVEKLLPAVEDLGPICTKVICLEQIVRSMIDTIGLSKVSAEVRKMPTVDKALGICFGIAVAASYEDCIAGLDSYIDNLRLQAPSVLSSDSIASICF